MKYMAEYDKWMASPFVDEATKEELRSISSNSRELLSRFSSFLEFGTAGLRGIMRAGPNGMNIYTVRHATQGLANVILALSSTERGPAPTVVIAYDCRNNSLLFAREAASVLAANGIRSRLFDELRPTPELSFALRQTGSIAGINVTASHNPKEYNGYKVYWSDGAQLSPDSATRILDSMNTTDIFEDVKTISYEEAISKGMVSILGNETDKLYLDQVIAQSVSARHVRSVSDTFSIIYTPFHGAGYKLIPEALSRLGIKNLLSLPSQSQPDGDFPTMKSPNPENKEGFASAIELARKKDVDLIIATDPDADRVGVMIRNGSEYETLTGNQVGVLLLDYLICAHKEQGTLPDNSAVVKSIVTTPMANAICRYHGIAVFETLTGFKFIGEKIKEFEETGEYSFLFGFEESYGYLSGTYCRDKDAVVASMLIAEMACKYRTKNMNLHEAMEALYEKYGCFLEKVFSITFDGYDGPENIKKTGQELRANPPKEFSGIPIIEVVDYLDTKTTGMTSSDVLFYTLEGGCSVVVRPSGTEPKIKLYLMSQGCDKFQCTNLLKVLEREILKRLRL